MSFLAQWMSCLSSAAGCLAFFCFVNMRELHGSEYQRMRSSLWECLNNQKQVNQKSAISGSPLFMGDQCARSHWLSPLLFASLADLINLKLASQIMLQLLLRT